MNLILGTAQLGLDYSVANSKGLMDENEACMLLDSLPSLDIDFIDTAAAYGNSENVIGCHSNEKTKIITKLDPTIKDDSNLSKSLWASVENSLTRLKRENVYAILLHRSSLVTEKNKKIFENFVYQLKSQGLINKFGVSIYDPGELDFICDLLEIDLVQAPLNAFDQRLSTSGWLEKLNASGIEVHARSIFLQGLLLMPLNSIPSYFSKWTSEISRWHKYADGIDASPVKAALSVVNSFEIEHLVVGVNSLSQLEDIIIHMKSLKNAEPCKFSVDDLDLILPTNWKID